MKNTWQKVTWKLETEVNLWKGRTLSLWGKALVINTCMVSRTVYTASVFLMPTETLTEINKVIWPFQEDNSPDLVPCEQTTRPLSEGGVGIVDISDKVRSTGMRAIELFRAKAVEYDRLETDLDRVGRAKVRSWTVAESLKNGWAGSSPEFKNGTKTNLQVLWECVAKALNYAADTGKPQDELPTEWLCTDGCAGRKTVGNLQKEWQQNGEEQFKGDMDIENWSQLVERENSFTAR